ncbi:glycoside hydrolase family 28 protein [Rudanella lutea]|uniref:glycoside hydrolase family 28 protein n=1 Tax=Rudanella lutea TaxID=451374 RepID=UPI00035F0D89|nr:glycoside hydrolase family 28 protein [Rudanella lutea]
MKNLYPLLTLLLLALSGYAQTRSYVITAFGAVADGETNNATMLQKLIDRASAQGGGRVVVPLGNFMTGSIFLKSNVELHLQKGARLLGSPNLRDYSSGRVALKSARPGEYNDYGNERIAVVAAHNQTNVSITGKGVIDGQGQELMLDIFKKLRSGEIKQDTIWKVKRPSGRALVLNMTGCKKVTVTGITLKNSSEWVQDYRECDGVTIDGITVQSTTYWNNDGLDLTDTRNVRITNCFINSADDGICLKSDNPRSGCENVTIENCTIRSSANGLKFGTTSAGGFKNVKARNLTIFDTYRSAIALELVDGGTMEGIDIRDVVARNTGNAIFIRRGHRNKTGAVGSIRGVYIANVKAEVPLLKPDQGYPLEGPPDHLRPGEDKMPKRPSSFHIYGHPYLPYNLVPASITGLPGYPVQDVTLENIEISYGGRADKTIAHIPLDKITSVPENEAGYPEFSMFGELPAWGFYVRHAEGIRFKNLRLRYVEEDFRPALIFDDARQIELSDVSVLTANQMPVIMLNNTAEVKTTNLKLPVDAEKGILKTNYGK